MDTNHDHRTTGEPVDDHDHDADHGDMDGHLMMV